ncbi:MAG TPA: FG-GAP-like repeat-containing protein [Terracidiphilus sp.]|jgi:hypothetical protein
MRKLLFRRDRLAVADLKPGAALLVGLWIFLGGVATRASSAPAPTSTALLLTSAGSPISTVAAGSVVTLTAAVKADGPVVTTGQVRFCDAAATYCTDVHLLGTQQLNGAGTAALSFTPGIGRHSYNAVFLGTATHAASKSGDTALTVPATIATATSIAVGGSDGNYKLTASVTETGASVLPAGLVSFLDTTDGNTVLGTAALGNGTASLSWTNAPSPAVALGPYALALGDFNGDGLADFAVTSMNGGVTILLGNGDGTFATAANSPVMVGNGPGAVVSGDFNGDGRLDLAVANSDDATLTILLGNGDGSFMQAPGSPITVGIQPRSIALDDFNSDGILDLAVANGKDGTVTILLGNGDGTFYQAHKSPVTVGMTPYSLATGDLNGDGVPDVAVANGASNAVTILVGNGDGTFTQAPVSPVTPGYAPTFVAIGDLNADGKADLAVVNNGNNTVTILLNNGDGTFTQPAASPLKVGTSPYSIALGDFNGDGIPDVAVANACGNGPSCKASSYKGTVSILQGNGDGTFTPASISAVPVGNWPISVAAADFSRDGIPDLAITNYSSGTVTVLLSQLTQTVTATATGISPVGAGTHQVQANYPGDSVYSASTSATASLAVQPLAPVVTVTPVAATITTTQALPVTVTVAGGARSLTPTGSVVLTSGSFTSSATILNGAGAIITIPAGSLAIGADTLTAHYAGDGNFSPNTGTASVTVTSPLNPRFTLGGTTVILAAGAIAGNTSSITVTPADGFTGSVILTAALASSPADAQYPPSLSFGATSPVNITGATAANATLTITTIAATSAALSTPKRNRAPWYPAGGAVLACVLLFALPAQWHRWRTMLGMLVFLAALTGGVFACGGGGDAAGVHTGHSGTTAGTYTVTLTGTSGAAKATGSIILNVH